MEKPATATLIPAWNEGAQCGLAEEPWLRFLHDITFGAQNECEAEFNGMGTAEKPWPFRIDTTKPALSCVLKTTATFGNQRQFNLGYGSSAYGITNVRLFCPDKPDLCADDFNTIELEIGGARCDRAYKAAMGTCIDVTDRQSTYKVLMPNLWSLQWGRVLLLHSFHATRINFETVDSSIGDRILLMYDTVAIEGMTSDKLNKGLSFPHFQWQFTGVEELYMEADTYTVRCQFNHLMMDIHLRTENPIAAARLVLDGRYEIPFTYDKERGRWLIIFSSFGEGGAIGDLGTTLNGSRVDRLTLELQPVKGESGVVPPGKVAHWTQNFHPGCSLAGMCGLRFSK